MRFRLFSTPIYIQPFFWFTAIVLAWFSVQNEPENDIEKMAIFVAVMLTGVLAHEFGHAIAGRAFGLTPKIELHGMGGVTSWSGSGRALTPGKSIVVSVAGPFVGIVIGLVALAGWVIVQPADGTIAYYTFFVIGWVNLGWGVLNLIPMLPLDGGNVMSSFFELFSPGKGRLVARYISMVLGVALAALAFGTGQLFMGIIVGWLVLNNFRALRVERQIGDDLPLAPELRVAQQAILKGDLANGAQHAERIVREAKTPVIRGEALTLLAWARLLSGDLDGADETLRQMPPGRKVDPALRGAILFERGHTAQAIPHLSQALGRGGRLVEERLAKALVDAERFDEAAELFASPKAHQVAAEILEKLEEKAYQAGAYEAAAKLGEVLFDREGTGIRAFNTACSLSRAGLHDKAVKWLQKARKAGFERTELLDSDEDLAPVRARHDWAELRASFD